MTQKSVLILGANSDVARAAIIQYAANGCRIVAASRSIAELQSFVAASVPQAGAVTVLYFDAADFAGHRAVYDALPEKPHIVVYAAGYLKHNEEAMLDFEGAFRMMQVHYAGAVSILNIIVTDPQNTRLERIIGLSSLSGVRGRKSNFIYGSTKAAFTQYLAGLRQYLFPRRVTVNVIVAGYIRSKMTAGLNLPESLMLEPAFIASAVVNAGMRFTIVPGLKWKLIYLVLKYSPEKLVARLP
jgi:short-subunit dehydrogenase